MCSELQFAISGSVRFSHVLRTNLNDDTESVLSVLFCSSAVLDPTVGHTMDVLSPFISVLCHSDWLFHGESCPRLDVVQPKPQAPNPNANQRR